MNTRVNRNKNNTDKITKVRKVLLVLLPVVLVVIAIAGFKAYGVKQNLDTTYSDGQAVKSRDSKSVLSNKKPISVLLLGTDTGDMKRSYKGRTDSIMIATVNPKTQKTDLISLPRDSMISVVGYENEFPQKLNAAYSFGDSGTTINTIQKWLNVPIDFYATVNMGGIEKLVDDLGGVDVVSPLTFDYEGVSFKEGEKQHLNGFQALKFSRMRYDDPQGDYGRQARQRLVIEAMINKIKDNPASVNSALVNDISKNLKTNVRTNSIPGLAKDYIGAAKNISSNHLEGESKMYNGVSYEFVTQDKKQNITNLIRSDLGLPAEKTGALYGGDVLNSAQDQNVVDATEGTSTDATGSEVAQQ